MYCKINLLSLNANPNSSIESGNVCLTEASRSLSSLALFISSLVGLLYGSARP